MSDAESRRQKNTVTRSTSRFEIREPTKPKPPQLRPLLDLDEGFPELRPRRSRVTSNNLVDTQSVAYDDDVSATHAETRALQQRHTRDLSETQTHQHPADLASRRNSGSTGRYSAAPYEDEDDYVAEPAAPRSRSGNTGRHDAVYDYPDSGARRKAQGTARHKAVAYPEDDYDYEPVRPFTSHATSGPSILSVDDQPSWSERFFGNRLIMLMLAACCLLIYVIFSKPADITFSNYSTQILTGGQVILLPAVPMAEIPETPPGHHTVMGAPTISPSDIERILQKYGSPATGTGQDWYDLGIKYSIDPAYAVAFFIHESSAGTNPAWAGMKPDGSTTHNVGNIICAGYPTCYGRFRDYESWYVGIEDWYKLISREYIGDRTAHTVEQIIPIYAPSFENDVQNYVNVVVNMVEDWRRNGVK